MKDYEQKNEEEILYLENTLEFIKKELEKEQYELNDRGQNLIDSRRDMWQESVHLSNDFDKIPEMVQYLSEVNNQSDNYEKTIKRIKKYTRVLNTPYFGRFDFQEDGFEDKEKIYVGLYNLIDNETSSILVYDWRSPISSIFYQCEIGKGSYKSPDGIISGDISMKRQYKIQNSQLKYFFDSSTRINDDILQDALGHNSSSEMKNIAETIQKEQDIIIRDNENELLIVQGVAGSGKTSIALHRIAFLLYIGMDSKINSNNILIISPNSAFSEYISGVLPELGEENVLQTTFDDIVRKALGNSFKKETLDKEYITYEDCAPLLYIKLKFEGSKEFSNIRQVVIDEAQDYYVLQYQVFKLLFKEPRYTVLGDFNQTIEKYGDKFLYDDIENILHKKKSVKLFLNKSYRSSVEINAFTQKILNSKQEFVPFERHKAEPTLVFKENLEFLNQAIARDIEYYQSQGYESIAVICKTEKEAVEVQKKLKRLTNVKVLNIDDSEILKGAVITPSYKAKGLEFDVVLVYNVSKDNYTSEFDRRLLYIACTRALHELVAYYTGEKSELICF